MSLTINKKRAACAKLIGRSPKNYRPDKNVRQADKLLKYIDQNYAWANIRELLANNQGCWKEALTSAVAELQIGLERKDGE